MNGNEYPQNTPLDLEYADQVFDLCGYYSSCTCIRAEPEPIGRPRMQLTLNGISIVLTAMLLLASHTFANAPAELMGTGSTALQATTTTSSYQGHQISCCVVPAFRVKRWDRSA